MIVAQFLTGVSVQQLAEPHGVPSYQIEDVIRRTGWPGSR